MHTHHVDAFNAAIRFNEIGRRDPAVVFLAGMGLRSTEIFLPVVELPEIRRRRLLFIDPLGTGLSDAPEEFDYSLIHQSTAIAEVLHARGVAGATVVGYSSGGSLAAVLADEHVDLVARVVLLEASPVQGGGSISPWIARQTERSFCDDGHRQLLARFDPTGREGAGAAALHGFFARTAPHALYRAARALVEPLSRDLITRVTELTIPCTYIRGGQHGSELDDGHLSLLRAAGVAILTVPAAGHLLGWEDPEGFLGALRQALA